VIGRETLLVLAFDFTDDSVRAFEELLLDVHESVFGSLSETLSEVDERFEANGSQATTTTTTTMSVLSQVC